MGYILKQKTGEGKYVVKLFYSKPENGYYADDIIAINRKEYDEHYSKLENDDYVFLEGWCDTSAELHSKESLGINITDTFFLDCILQGQKIDYDIPVEFSLT